MKTSQFLLFTLMGFSLALLVAFLLLVLALTLALS